MSSQATNVLSLGWEKNMQRYEDYLATVYGATTGSLAALTTIKCPCCHKAFGGGDIVQRLYRHSASKALNKQNYLDRLGHMNVVQVWCALSIWCFYFASTNHHPPFLQVFQLPRFVGGFGFGHTNIQRELFV